MTDRPLAARIKCRAQAIDKMGRFGVRGRICGEMVDAAMEMVEAKAPYARDGSNGWQAAAIEHLAIEGARTKATSVLTWLAFQVFKAFIVQIIVNWFLNRSQQHA